MTVDLVPDHDLDRVAGIAMGVAEHVRTDPGELFTHLTMLWAQQPAKAAQVTMTLAVWLDPDTPLSELRRRVEDAIQEAAFA